MNYSGLDLRKIKDIFAKRFMFCLCLCVLSLALFIVAGLCYKSKPIFATVNLKDIIFSTTWRPLSGEFGLGSFIIGTLWVTAIAMFIAVPLSVLTAIYLCEYANRRLRDISEPTIDVLAGISPIVYGVWGVIAVVPLVRNWLMPFFSKRLPFFPFASDNFTGFSVLSAGIVLAVMIFPIIIAISKEALKTVPFEIREASLALGATKWQTIKYAVLKKAWPGIIAAIILGFSRAFGETMAVLMVAGCAIGVIPKSIFDAGYPLSALIANTYGEMMSIPLYDSAILLAALMLLAVTTLFNIIGWGVLLHIQAREY